MGEWYITEFIFGDVASQGSATIFEMHMRTPYSHTPPLIYCYIVRTHSLEKQKKTFTECRTRWHTQVRRHAGTLVCRGYKAGRLAGNHAGTTSKHDSMFHIDALWFIFFCTRERCRATPSTQRAVQRRLHCRGWAVGCCYRRALRLPNESISPCTRKKVRGRVLYPSREEGRETTLLLPRRGGATLAGCRI